MFLLNILFWVPHILILYFSFWYGTGEPPDFLWRWGRRDQDRRGPHSVGPRALEEFPRLSGNLKKIKNEKKGRKKIKEWIFERLKKN
jgi:hypothetical protein